MTENELKKKAIAAELEKINQAEIWLCHATKSVYEEEDNDACNYIGEVLGYLRKRLENEQ